MELFGDAFGADGRLVMHAPGADHTVETGRVPWASLKVVVLMVF
ncbi:hypothetical protein ACFT8P_13855 [Streptomyces sp. NPDC057101]